MNFNKSNDKESRRSSLGVVLPILVIALLAFIAVGAFLDHRAHVRSVESMAEVLGSSEMIFRADRAARHRGEGTIAYRLGVEGVGAPIPCFRNTSGEVFTIDAGRWLSPEHAATLAEALKVCKIFYASVDSDRHWGSFSLVDGS